MGVKVFKYLFLTLFLLFPVFSYATTVSGLPVTSDPDFTMVLFPDIQNMTFDHSAIWETEPAWVVANKISQNIKAVIGLGDNANTDSHEATSQTEAAIGYTSLDVAGIPYVDVPGNHDYDFSNNDLSGRVLTTWNTYFGGSSRVANQSYFGGQYDATSGNYWIKVDVGSYKFLILSLELFPRTAVLNWAQTVVSANPDREVIVATHGYLNPDGTRTLHVDDFGPDAYNLNADNDAQQMWDNFIKLNPNIFLVVSGHQVNSAYSSSRVDVGSNGNLVYQLFLNHQYDTNGGNGYMGLLKFRPTLGRIEVSSYSAFLSSSDSRDSYAFPFATSYNASHILGQFNVDGSANYTKSGINNGPNAQGFNTPSSSILDSVNHRLFVSDTTNNRVLVFTLGSTNNVSNLANTTASFVLGQPDLMDSSSLTANFATQKLLNTPKGLAYDSVNRRLFVADTGNNRVMVFNVDPTSISSGEQGSVVLGQGTGGFLTKATSNTNIELNGPNGLAYDSASKRLFVADTANNRVVVFDADPATISSGEAASNVLGESGFGVSTGGTTINRLKGPSTLAYDSDTSRLFVADTANNRVMIFDVAVVNDGEDAIFVLGQSGFSTAATANTSVGMNAPQGVVYDSTGKRLFVADTANNRVTEFNADPIVLISNGLAADHVLGQTAFGAGGATTTQNRMNGPIGLEYDSANSNLFVADSANNRLLLFSVAGSISDGANATATLGQNDILTGASYFAKLGANNGPNPIGFSQDARGLALDSSGHRLFFSDRGNNRILVFNLDSDNNISSATPAYVLGQPNFYSNTAATTRNGLSAPNALAYDAINDRIFVSEVGNNRVTVFNVSPSVIINGENADHVIGQADFISGSASVSASRLNAASGLVYDTDNNRLFLCDFNNNRVLIFNNMGPATISDGSSANFVWGQVDFSGTSSGTTASKFSGPRGLEYDSVNKRIFTAERDSSRVMIFNADPNTITTNESATFVLGQTGFGSVGSAPTQSITGGPIGLSYDPNSKILYVSDAPEERILAFDVNTATIHSGENASAIIGANDFTSHLQKATQTNLDQLQYIVYDSTKGRLFAADFTNSRILQFDIVKINPASLSDTLTGRAFSQTINVSNAVTTAASQGILTLSEIGSLPNGVSFNPTSGVLSGTSMDVGTFNFTIQADNSFPTIGHFLNQQAYSLRVLAPSGSGPLLTGSSGPPIPPGSTSQLTISLSSPIFSTSIAPVPSPAPITPVSIDGCGNRTTGFSISTGQSCVGNIPSTPSGSMQNPTYDFGLATLRRGSFGPAVYDVQRSFNFFLNAGLVLDGKFGFKTLEMVKNWQQSKGLVVDGVVGPKTKASMYAAATSR